MFKKISYITSVCAVIALALIVGAFKTDVASANPSTLNISYQLASSTAPYLGFRTSPTSVFSATTTGVSHRNFVTTATASTTFSFVTEGADVVYVPMSVTASTTATVFQLRVAYSYDGSNYFNEDAYTQTSNILFTHASTTAVHAFQPATTATSTKVFVLQNIGAKYMKLTFDVTGANGSFWFAAVTKRQAQ